ncbi:MAG: hypothetical protein RR317_01655 [Bilophila sp.]
MDILVATEKEAVWDAFSHYVRDKGSVFTTVATLGAVQTHLRTTPPDLIILDIQLEDKALAEAVISLLKINAGVHTAVVTTMPEEAFHTKTEGLGILMSLPKNPTAKDAETVLAKLASLHPSHD